MTNQSTINQDMLNYLENLHICHHRCHSGHLCRTIDKDHSRHDFGCAEHALSAPSNKIVVDHDCRGSWGEQEIWSGILEVSREEAVADHLRCCLGLTPWETFRKHRVKMTNGIRTMMHEYERRWVEFARGTGRTTRGIVTAIADCLMRQSKFLVISSQTSISTHCRKVAEGLIEQLGLEITVESRNRNLRYATASRNAVVYSDHTFNPYT